MRAMSVPWVSLGENRPQYIRSALYNFQVIDILDLIKGQHIEVHASLAMM